MNLFDKSFSIYLWVKPEKKFIKCPGKLGDCLSYFYSKIMPSQKNVDRFVMFLLIPGATLYLTHTHRISLGTTLIASILIIMYSRICAIKRT